MRIIRSGIALALILCCLSCEGLFLQTSAVTDGELKLSAETCHKFEMAEEYKATKIKERSR
jgi:hypothetical protein